MFIYITVTGLENSLNTLQSCTIDTVWFRGKPTLCPSSLSQRTHFNVICNLPFHTLWGSKCEKWKRCNLYPSSMDIIIGIANVKKRENKLLSPFRCLHNFSVNLMLVDSKAFERSFLYWNNFRTFLWWLKVSKLCIQHMQQL